MTKGARHRQTFFLTLGLFLLSAASLPAQTAQESFNRKPLTDFAAVVKKQIAQNKLDVSKPFLVQVKGVLTENGGLDGKQTFIVKTEGDAAMAEVGKMFIEAMSDSGLLKPFGNMGVEKLSLTLQQDETNLSLALDANAKNASRAKAIATMLTMYPKLSQFQYASELEKLLISNMKATAEENNLSIIFSLPKNEALATLRKELSF